MKRVKRMDIRVWKKKMMMMAQMGPKVMMAEIVKMSLTMKGISKARRLNKKGRISSPLSYIC